MKQFIRGERAKLTDLAAINHIWDIEVSIDAPFFVVDFCCMGLDANGQVTDDRYLISFNQPDAPQNEIQLDNVSNTGASFRLYLERLPPTVRRLVFTATLHEPEMPGGILGAALSLFGVDASLRDNMGDGYLALRTPAMEVGYFPFSAQDFGAESTLILGEFYWRDEWRLVAAGQPLRGKLSAFLRTLTDGPMPFPVVPPTSQNATHPVAVPPRQPRPVPNSTPVPPVSISAPITSPATPISAPVRPSHVPPPAPVHPALQPVAESLSSPSLPVAPLSSVMPSFPQELAPGTKLQDLIDAAAPGSTLVLMSDEYEGPIVIRKPITLEGRDSALWCKMGPVVTVDASPIVLRNLEIEVTVSQDATDGRGVALKFGSQAAPLHLDNVRLHGRISGLGAEDGDWVLPLSLDLGHFAARAANEFLFSVRVPTKVRLSSPIAGVSIFPNEIGPGQHQITLQVNDVAPETLLIGFIEVRSTALVQTVPVRGSAHIDAKSEK